jgi:hypothetical protein
VRILWKIVFVEKLAENCCGRVTETIRRRRRKGLLPSVNVTRGQFKTKTTEKSDIQGHDVPTPQDSKMYL